MNVLGTVLVLTGVSFVWLMVACTILRIRGRIDHWPEWAANTIGSGCLTAYWILRAGWNGWLGVSALTTLGSAWLWRKWWRRRKRRRALAMLGAKSRARLAALVGTMRRKRKPSRVLRPQRVPS